MIADQRAMTHFGKVNAIWREVGVGLFALPLCFSVISQNKFPPDSPIRVGSFNPEPHQTFCLGSGTEQRRFFSPIEQLKDYRKYR